MNFGDKINSPFTPAKAGAQSCLAKVWVPACAGTNGVWDGVLIPREVL